jgi:hypothetical protein
MNLHHDIKLFSDTLRAASQHLDIKLEFVEKYQAELSALAYRPIPDEKDVAKCFEELIKRIE